MSMRSVPRRLTGALLMATLTPWMLSCHREVKAPLDAPAPLVGKVVQIKVAAGADANTIASDGSRRLVTGVTRLEGVLLQATSDSIRLGTATLWLANGQRVAGLREAVIHVTSDISSTRSEIEPVRTTLAVAGVVLLALTLVTMAAIGGALHAIVGSGAHPASPQ